MWLLIKELKHSDFVARSILDCKTWVHTDTFKNCTARSRVMCWDTCFVCVAGNTVSLLSCTVPQGHLAQTRPVVLDSAQSRDSSSTEFASVVVVANAQFTRVAPMVSQRAMVLTTWNPPVVCSPLLRYVHNNYIHFYFSLMMTTYLHSPENLDELNFLRCLNISFKFLRSIYFSYVIFINLINSFLGTRWT